jgi:hypothetical protein
MKQENISLLLAGEICYLFVISTGYRTEIIFVHIISTMCPPSNSHLVNHTIHGTRGRFFEDFLPRGAEWTQFRFSFMRSNR